MKQSFILILCFVFTSISYALDFSSSKLPIVIITTDTDSATGKPLDILDDPRVLGNMKIIYRPDNSLNYLADQNNTDFLNYDGRISIETRGSSSQSLEKKPYGLTTLQADNTSNNNVSILGMPEENDWILNSLAFDPSLIRDYLSYSLSTAMGNYASRGVYCEVIVNNDYRGLYVFMEKLKVDKNRINILKMTQDDISGDNLTGGYITKCDKTTGDDPVAWNSGWGADFIHDSPKPTEITSQQSDYIKEYFTAFNKTTTDKNSSIYNGYPTFIDVPSFVDFIIMNELASNVDGYQISTYFHKDKKGKLRAGPIWDFNLTYGNDLFEWGFDRSFTYVWQLDDGSNTGAKFWKKLFYEPTFKCYLTKRWVELTAQGQALNYNTISTRIDQIVSLISDAAVREQTRWGRVGNHATQISNLKTWLQTRINWLNTNLNNYQSCANIQVPPLVISRIHYHPESDVFPGDSLEFIEITNNSSSSVNLTGIYFAEPGLSYQFPTNSTIGANKKIVLASNANDYKLFYNETAFGQYTRELSNKSQKLILCDAFGNVIDMVEYSDDAPWPQQADGDGYWLELADVNADNALFSNWKAANQIESSVKNLISNRVRVYLDPTNNYINISCTAESVTSYRLSDITGRIIMTGQKENKINVSQLNSNISILSILFSDGSQTVAKIIK